MEIPALEIFWPPDTHFASPRANTITASVAMNGCMRKRATIPPESSPQVVPERTTSGIAAHADQPRWMLRIEKITAQTPRMLPTARSIPPVMITRVIPQARIP